jgi:O-antigen/teichoic acid export membrane protein
VLAFAVPPHVLVGQGADPVVVDEAHAAAAAAPSAVDLFREGGWLTVSNIVGPMMVTFDRFAIASLVSLAAASYYFVPQEVSLRLLVIPSAIATTIFPMLARIDRQGTDRRRITHGAVQAVAASCLPVCAIIAAFASPLLSLWMGARFAAESAVVAACLASGLFANCCAQVPFAWIQAAGRSDVTGKLHLLQLPIYAVLLLVLVTHFGIVGAAVAWSARATADAALLYAASARLFPDDALAPAMPPIVAGLAVLVLLGMTPAIADPAVRAWTSGTLLACSVAVAAFVALQFRKVIHR